MGFRTAGIAAFLLAAVLSAPALAADNWPKFSEPEFSVTFPDYPVGQEDKVGSVERHLYLHQGAKGRIFTVLVDAYAPSSLKGHTIQADADTVLGAFATRSTTKIVDRRPVTVSGRTGIEALFKAADGDELTGRFFMVGDKLIVAVYAHHGADSDLTERQRFFDSLVLK